MQGFQRWMIANRRQLTSSNPEMPDCSELLLTREPWTNRIARLAFILLSVLYIIVVRAVDTDTASGSLDELILGWITAAVIAYGVRHLYLVLRYEIGHKDWYGGTTGCLRDGDVLRSGRGDIWDTL